MIDIPILEIYLDILFILNFIMDYFIFWMVSKITYQKVSKKRLFFGSILAALLYCMIVTVPFLRIINIGIYLLLLPLIPITIIFKPSNIKQLIQFFVVSNITAFVVGGMSFGVYYWIVEQNIISQLGQKNFKEISIWILLISSISSYLLIKMFKYYTQKRNTSIQKRYSLKIEYNNLSVEMEALLDTGNKVYDPITKDPVIIAEYKKLEPLLADKVKNAYLTKNEDISFLIEEASKSDLGVRVRAIPYHSLGNPNGILLGFKPDKVYISAEDLPQESVENVIIAIYQHDLHIEGIYHALLHADLINNKI